jgi:hypothetical protein
MIKRILLGVAEDCETRITKPFSSGKVPPSVRFERAAIFSAEALESG